uniref:Uncharacterized protein LOC100373905 n=1 Tax=Saccoglossus kowalevskii TaxID=10224 RepID=A0ABM0LWA9_SACKO|nr:PREDICTED: uncharacterized protein LOC100373905 [Saccoglossus kowalevskii]
MSVAVGQTCNVNRQNKGFTAIDVKLLHTDIEIDHAQDSCNPDEFGFEDSCYYISTNSGSWDAGVTECSSLGYYLAEIDSFDEHQSIINYIQGDPNLNNNKQLWVGATSLPDGIWHWNSGANLTYTDLWIAGRPVAAPHPTILRTVNPTTKIQATDTELTTERTTSQNATGPATPVTEISSPLYTTDENVHTRATDLTTLHELTAPETTVDSTMTTTLGNTMELANESTSEPQATIVHSTVSPTTKIQSTGTELTGRMTSASTTQQLTTGSVDASSTAAATAVASTKIATEIPFPNILTLSYAGDPNLINENKLWVGATSLPDGVWHWNSGTNLTYTDLWDAGRPVAGGGRECGILESKSQYNMKDIRCNTNSFPICERNIALQPTSTYTRKITTAEITSATEVNRKITTPEIPTNSTFETPTRMTTVTETTTNITTANTSTTITTSDTHTKILLETTETITTPNPHTHFTSPKPPTKFVTPGTPTNTTTLDTPITIINSKTPTKFLNQGTATKVTTHEFLTKITTSETPRKIPTSEIPTNITNPDTPTEIATLDIPTNTTTPETLTNITIADIYTKITTSELPKTITASKMPITISTPQTSFDISSETPTQSLNPEYPTTIITPKRPTKITIFNTSVTTRNSKTPTFFFTPEAPTKLATSEIPTKITTSESPTKTATPETPGKITTPENPTTIITPEKPTKITAFSTSVTTRNSETPTKFLTPEASTKLATSEISTKITTSQIPTKIATPETPGKITTPENPTTIITPERPTKITTFSTSVTTSNSKRPTRITTPDLSTKITASEIPTKSPEPLTKFTTPEIPAKITETHTNSKTRLQTTLESTGSLYTTEIQLISENTSLIPTTMILTPSSSEDNTTEQLTLETAYINTTTDALDNITKISGIIAIVAVVITFCALPSIVLLFRRIRKRKKKLMKDINEERHYIEMVHKSPYSWINMTGESYTTVDPGCRAFTCSNPWHPMNGELVNMDSIRFPVDPGTTVDFTCCAGFEPLGGVDRMTCMEDASGSFWQPSEVICDIICNADEIKTGLTCYYISPKKGSWDDGVAECTNLGYYAAIVDSFDEHQILIDILQNRKGIRYWVGATAVPDGIWRWHSGDPITYTQIWEPGNPSDAQQQCGVLTKQGGYYMSDVPCGTTSVFICERSGLITCDDPGIPANGELLTPVIFPADYFQILTFNCLPGFQLIGDMSIICGVGLCSAAYNWNNTIPECVKIETTTRKTTMVTFQDTTITSTDTTTHIKPVSTTSITIPESTTEVAMQISSTEIAPADLTTKISTPESSRDMSTYDSLTLPGSTPLITLPASITLTSHEPRTVISKPQSTTMITLSEYATEITKTESISQPQSSAEVTTPEPTIEMTIPESTSVIAPSESTIITTSESSRIITSPDSTRRMRTFEHSTDISSSDSTIPHIPATGKITTESTTKLGTLLSSTFSVSARPLTSTKLAMLESTIMGTTPEPTTKPPTAIPVCSNDSCKNDGKCFVIYSNNTISCSCQEGFAGPRCEYPIDILIDAVPSYPLDPIIEVSAGVTIVALIITLCAIPSAIIVIRRVRKRKKKHMLKMNADSFYPYSIDAIGPLYEWQVRNGTYTSNPAPPDD